MYLSRKAWMRRPACPPAPWLRRACLCYALSKMDGKNKLCFGDNLKILRDYVEDASVDLIYLDPPFNSSATYNFSVAPPFRAALLNLAALAFQETTFQCHRSERRDLRYPFCYHGASRLSACTH
mgnify:CR=1 FL=1